jgi:NADH:ubiquinone oxidoreductase subunit 6 (subunit J)
VISVEIKTGSIHAVPALIIVAVVAGTFAGLFYSTWHAVTPPPITLSTTTPTLGEMLMTGYLLPFEVASVVLLVALLGAALTARRARTSAEN